MSAMAAARLGYRCHVLTPEEDSPASQVSSRTFLGDYEDPALLRAFALSVDVITFEFENVSAEGPRPAGVAAPGAAVPPTCCGSSQDRVVEKAFLNEAGIATAAWLEIKSRAALHAAVARVGLPGVLKTTRGGYDGKGQAVLRSVGELNPVWEELEPKPLILEALVAFEREISVIVARGLDGGAVAFDAVENRHRNGILDITVAPAPIPPEMGARRGGHRPAGGGRAGAGGGAGGGDVRHGRRPGAWSTRSRRAPTTPAIGRSTPARPASSSCMSAPSPGCRCRRPCAIPTR